MVYSKRHSGFLHFLGGKSHHSFNDRCVFFFFLHIYNQRCLCLCYINLSCNIGLVCVRLWPLVFLSITDCFSAPGQSGMEITVLLLLTVPLTVASPLRPANRCVESIDNDTYETQVILEKATPHIYLYAFYICVTYLIINPYLTVGPAGQTQTLSSQGTLLRLLRWKGQRTHRRSMLQLWRSSRFFQMSNTKTWTHWNTGTHNYEVWKFKSLCEWLWICKCNNSSPLHHWQHGTEVTPTTGTSAWLPARDMPPTQLGQHLIRPQQNRERRVEKGQRPSGLRQIKAERERATEMDYEGGDSLHLFTTKYLYIRPEWLVLVLNLCSIST